MTVWGHPALRLLDRYGAAELQRADVWNVAFAIRRQIKQYAAQSRDPKLIPNASIRASVIHGVC